MIIGTAIGTSSVRPECDVMDVGEVSAGGNTLIRAGSTIGDTWHQSLHIVLTPAEREQLITVLIGQRHNDDVLRSERNMARKEWPAPGEKSHDAEAIRKWVMYGDYSDTDDPWYSLIVEWESERRRKHNG